MRVSLAVLLLVAMGVAVKGSDCPNGEDTLLTYNTALTPTIPGFEDRRDRIPAAVATEAANADFLCFQELWYEEDVRGVLEAVEDDFPYHYSYLHYDVSDMTGHRRRRVENGAPFLCSHLTSVSLNTYYEAKLPYSSYTEQQQAEIQDLENKFSGTPHVLMGDLNTGPGRSGEGDENLIAEAPDNYNMLVSDMGYDNPYLDGDGRCTFCESNLVVQTRGLTGNKVIDHILVKDLGNDSSSAQRVLDDPALGQLSDHYGIRAGVCRA
nr:hypothetical protein BaRGS_021189 [Batillaria attramentaria]